MEILKGNLLMLPIELKKDPSQLPAQPEGKTFWKEIDEKAKYSEGCV
jgi:hypothetical protein